MNTLFNLAYIDAGTGSLMLQVIIASLASLFLFLDRIRHKIHGGKHE